MNDDRAAWHEQRRQAVAGHAAALDAARAADAAQAKTLLADFIQQAAKLGLQPGRLHARSLDGKSRYRTRLRGWYLKTNQSVAVGEDGDFYVLTVPGSVRARFTGAEVEPSVPRLMIGAGGGDGETMALAELLQRCLDAGTAAS